MPRFWRCPPPPFGAAEPYPPRHDEYVRVGGCVSFPYRELPIAAYETALDKANALDLHREPAVHVALDRLAVLDPEGHPRRWERIPSDPASLEDAP